MKHDWKKFLLATRIWQPLTDFWAGTTAWPVVGRYLGYVLGDGHYDVTFIPINERLEEGGSTVLPRRVVEEMLERSCHRVIIPLCLCRVGCRCEDYPMEVGCIFMGESARDIDPSMGRAVSVEEAKEHLERAIDSGLIPQIGRVDPDPIMLGVKDRFHFLTLCFCCTCCCIAMRNMPRWAPEIRDRMHGLEGLEVRITGDCDGCGECSHACFAGAVSVQDGVAAIDKKLCKRCGLCASACPSGAIDIRVTDSEKMLDEVFRRIESLSDVT